MPQSDFTAQISAWVAQTKARGDAVLRESAQRVIEVMQTPVAGGGNMPVDTGFLRASLQATLGEPAASVTFNPGNAKVSYDDGAVNLVIAGAHLGDKISAVYSANYAVYVEYGSKGGSGRRFVGLAAQNWPAIVSQVSSEAQSRATGA